jgi:hypothetical protein
MEFFSPHGRGGAAGRWFEAVDDDQRSGGLDGWGGGVGRQNDRLARQQIDRARRGGDTAGAGERNQAAGEAGGVLRGNQDRGSSGQVEAVDGEVTLIDEPDESVLPLGDNLARRGMGTNDAEALVEMEFAGRP